jgi:hypothetical protein
MPTTSTPLGREALRQMLSPSGRLVIVNRSEADGDLRIVAAAIVRHDSAGPKREVLGELELAGDEAEWIDAPEDMAEPVALIEVLLQIAAGLGMVETYLSDEATPESTASGWETGICPLSEPLAPEEVPIPEIPGYAAYLKPFR